MQRQKDAAPEGGGRRWFLCRGTLMMSEFLAALLATGNLDLSAHCPSVSAIGRLLPPKQRKRPTGQQVQALTGPRSRQAKSITASQALAKLLIYSLAEQLI